MGYLYGTQEEKQPHTLSRLWLTLTGFDYIELFRRFTFWSARSTCTGSANSQQTFCDQLLERLTTDISTTLRSANINRIVPFEYYYGQVYRPGEGQGSTGAQGSSRQYLAASTVLRFERDLIRSALGLIAL